MKSLSNVFLSKILGNKLYDCNSNPVGRIIDLAASNDERLPKVVALCIKKRDGNVAKLSFDFIDIYEQDNGRLYISCNTMYECNEDNVVYLSKNLLDKQIVDINGRKVVRVNDLRMAQINGALKIIAVDVGFTGLLRRLGIDSAALEAVKVLKKLIHDNLITWDNVKPLKADADRLILTVPYKKAV